MIVDCHVHLNNYHEQVAYSLDDSLALLQRSMSESGVDYALHAGVLAAMTVLFLSLAALRLRAK